MKEMSQKMAGAAGDGTVRGRCCDVKTNIR
jgi:hypothetical protein